MRLLLRRTIETYRGQPAGASAGCEHNLARFDEPLRVAIAGKVKAGKSTLLNALVGEQIAPTDAGECTRIVTWYVDAQVPKVTMFPRAAPPRQLTIIAGSAAALSFDLQGTPVEQVDQLEVQWPSQSLRTQTLIDTPGIASLSADTSARAGAFLAPEDSPTQADAVIYLMRHLHATDVRFLESFYDQGVARATPINTIARAVAGRRDRRRPAGRAHARRAGSPAATGPTTRSAGCARPWSRWPGCSPRPAAPCARTSSPR